MSGLEMKYFVLNPNKDDEFGAASRIAILAYATQIRDTNKRLADDLEEWIGDLNEAIWKEEQ